MAEATPPTPEGPGDIAARYRRVAAQFTERVRAVAPAAWSRPSPCEGWTARDVVGHLVEWVPAYLSAGWDLGRPAAGAVAEDPARAWTGLDTWVQAILDDPERAGRAADTRGGRATLAATVDRIVTPDVLVHTWDLARATGQDDTLDAEEVHRFVTAMEPLDQVLRQSGHFGPRRPVPDGADEQTRLIAFLGRQP